MKILVDTCVWSLSLRRRDSSALNEEEQRMVASLGDAIQDGRVAIVGPIRQEVLSGIKEIAQFERLRRALKAFPDTPMGTPHYEEAARLFNLCRRREVECGAVDILLCAVAARERWSILTTDGGLKRCIETLRAEGVLH
ncbi:MAG: PIN domain-containing protein [Terracidiphilus sp.]